MPVILAALYQSRTTLFRAWTSSSPFASRAAWAPTSSKMSTFQHPEYHIPITLPEGLSQSQLLSFRPFANWLATLQTSLAAQHSSPDHPFHRDPYALRSITVQSYDLFGTAKGGGSAPRLGFVKLTSRVANGAGETLPGAVFLRGPSVAMLVLLVPDDVGVGDAADADAERRVLLTVQPRVAAGSLGFAELPAGMVDEGGTFAGQAAREMEEELGLVIGEHELVCLSDLAGDVGGAGEGVGGGGEGGEGAVGGEDHRLLPRAVYPSAGGCDEYIPIYMHERRVPREQLAQWSGKLTGLRDQGEKITLKLVRMRDLWKEGARDAKCLAAVALWEGLRREGKI
ncbi:uncharacterized protein P884DRAFT_274950 [Thermothelomyces heterothallicus CBS 202.75]|uniref:uncharacterized protein n=1 Tax=Thermothelomyces heterothallicus CBS 202.75 TaxID=1149848 RepID=UPI003742E9C8